MIQMIAATYRELPRTQKEIANGFISLGSGLFFGTVAVISGQLAVKENVPALYLVEIANLTATVYCVKRAWRSFQAALN